MFKHEHPLNLIDLWSEHPESEEEYGEDEGDNEDPIAKQDYFRCLCFLCEEEINSFHRYYYTCRQCGYSIHKFCAQLPEKMEDIRHAHSLYSLQNEVGHWSCDMCGCLRQPHCLRYRCSQCDFDIDASCATKRLLKNIIHHPSHIHPLVCMPKQILSECDACGKEHKGIFYRCTVCPDSFIHSHCAFLPKKLQIQSLTNDFFSHTHPLTLAYSFPKTDQDSKFKPRCRICHEAFSNENLWIYKCEKCRYYTHLACATSRNEPFMSILISPGTGKTFKSFEDFEHPNLLHLPFPDPSYSILKHLFFKENEPSTSNSIEVTKTHISHQHPLTLVDAGCTDHIISPTSLRLTSISQHDPMKRIELLCNGCLRPIMNTLAYVCANEGEHCNFVLHEWCTRLPTVLKDHPDHPQHNLILYTNTPGNFFGVFSCDICSLPCNGFGYHCEECGYYIDVNCAFLPKEIAHASHPNHLFLRVYKRESDYYCRICDHGFNDNQFSFGCHVCDFHLHPECALLIPKRTTNKCDKHPLTLSYFPVENHKSEYFCEICEEEFDPEFSFYHCNECMQSIHPACAPLIHRYETYTSTYRSIAIYEYVNVKFGGIYTNTRVHPHPLSFVQGIESDGECNECDEILRYRMIFKCVSCKFAVDYECCKSYILV